MATTRLDLGEYCGSSLQRRQAGKFVVTENRFEAGTAIPPHEHIYAHFTAVLAGGFEERYQDLRLDCPAGTILIVPAAQPHTDVVGKDGAHTLGVELSRGLLKSFDGATDLMTRPRVFRSVPLQRRIERLSCEFRSLDPLSLFALEATATEILVECARSHRRAEPEEPSWLVAAMEAIHQDPGLGASLGQLAASVGVHEVQLARAFKRVQGCTVGEYARWLRLEAAKKRLSQTKTPLAEVALESGFYDQAHFSRAFKTAYGLSPSAYRERMTPDGTSG